jgi:hypothetical protein
MKHTTKDGREMNIADMDDGHLLNTIKWIERRAKEGVKSEVGFYDSCGTDHYYDEITYYGEEALEFLNYSSYVEEANRRNLDITTNRRG